MERRGPCRFCGPTSADAGAPRAPQSFQSVLSLVFDCGPPGGRTLPTCFEPTYFIAVSITAKDKPKEKQTMSKIKTTKQFKAGIDAAFETQKTRDDVDEAQAQGGVRSGWLSVGGGTDGTARRHDKDGSTAQQGRLDGSTRAYRSPNKGVSTAQQGRIDGATRAYRSFRRYALVEAARRHPRRGARIILSRRRMPTGMTNKLNERTAKARFSVLVKTENLHTG